LSPTLASTEQSAESMTRQAEELFRQGKRNEANDLQRQVLENYPTSWVGHAQISYMMWQQADIAGAIDHGERAAKLAPDNLTVLNNLALMQQAARDFDDAIRNYTRAARIAPASHVARVGLARCYLMKGDQAKGLKILSDMSFNDNASFDWYYYSGITCLKINQLKLAEKLISSACERASLTEQKSDARNALLLLQLRSDQPEQARANYQETIRDCHTSNHEVYVRAASTLVHSTEPDAGRMLLNSAVLNLKSPQDSRAFFNLGALFEGKATHADNLTTDAWLDNAQSAYKTAIDLAPREAGYHTSLASVLLRKNRFADASNELRTAHSLNKADPLPVYLLSHVLDAKAMDSNSLRCIRLSKAKYTIEELDCKCRLSKFQAVVANLDGVSFATARAAKIPEGVVVYDPTLVTVEKLFDTAVENYRKSMEALNQVRKASKPSKPIKISVIEEQPVTELDVVFKLEREAHYGQVLNFEESMVERFNRFNDIQPKNPSPSASLGAKSAPLKIIQRFDPGFAT
jgi:tetratricopeptide (TPR) repeat protein